MDYNKYLNKSKEKYNELEQIKKDAESMESTMMKPNLRIHKHLKEKDIKDLKIASQEQFDRFVDDILIHDIIKERIKKVPNVIYLGNLNEKLSNMLGLTNVKVYIHKNELQHAERDEKKEYNQDVPLENFKHLPTLIKNANEVYVDTINKHQNFFIWETLNDAEIATYHFDKDELGNYFITARRVKKETLNQKEYMLVRSGIEPHIEERTPSLPSGASLTNKLIESGDKSTYSSTNNETITDNTLNKAENESNESNTTTHKRRKP